MSLINDMLKDLDRRSAGADADIAGRDSHRRRSGQGASPVLWVLGVLVVILVVGGGGWLTLVQRDASRTVDESPELTTEQAPVAASPERSGEIAEANDDDDFVNEPVDGLESALSGTPGRSPAADKAAEAQEEMTPDHSVIEDLLAQARTARERDRLTRPAGDNAYEYYQQVLAQVADQPEALAGLAAIAQRYRELAEEAMDRDALEAAQRFLRRARSVSPEVSGIQSSETRLQELQESPSATDISASQPEVSEAQEENEASSLSVRPDPDSEDRRRATEARRWWSEGQVPRARAALEQTIAQWPHETVPPAASTALLIEIYLDTESYAEAQHLLAEPNGLPRDEQTRLQAELSMLRGNNAQALALLTEHLDQARTNEPYRALFARLSYAEGQHAQAAEHYARLLADFGGQAAYWLGLGLAEDARNQPLDASRAFRRALATGAYDDSPSIRRYLEGRLNALSPQAELQEP